MLATFTQENGLRGSYVLKAENPLGMFEPYSDGALTPEEWECLDATLYVSKSGELILFLPRAYANNRRRDLLYQAQQGA